MEEILQLLFYLLRLKQFVLGKFNFVYIRRDYVPFYQAFFSGGYLPDLDRSIRKSSRRCGRIDFLLFSQDYFKNLKHQRFRWESTRSRFYAPILLVYIGWLDVSFLQMLRFIQLSIQELYFSPKSNYPTSNTGPSPSPDRTA